jgi:ubiquinone/menaquinone biosynthesis C-methylase UbiE
MTQTRRRRRKPPKAKANEAVLANHRQLLERERFFRKFGYDLPKGIAFALTQALPLDGSVLEIGTGKGRFLMELAKRVATVTTVDITAKERMFARLDARFAGVETRIKFVLRDAGRLPWRDGSFDAAVTFNAMHHIPHFCRVLTEMLRVVKPGGKIVLGDFSPRGFQIMDRIHRAEGKTHQHEVHHFRDLRCFLRTRGLKTRLRKGCNQEVLVATLPSANE